MNRRYLRAGPLAGLCLLLILLSGACDNPANGDDAGSAAAAATAAAKAARDAADVFYAAHRGVFDLWPDTLTLADADPVNAALEAYTGLRVNVRILLAEEKARLDLLKSKLDEMLAGAEWGAYYTATDLLGYLVEQPENTAADPCAVAYYGDENILALYKVLTVAGKYVALDLSKSGVYGFAPGNETGRELIVSLVLPDTLTETPNGGGQYTVLFSGYANLKTVSAAGLATLGAWAFRLCTELASANLPKAATIGDGAFADCTSLASVNLPEAVTLIRSAFVGCTALATVSLPKAETIGAYTFSGCTALASVNLPNAATIGLAAFGSCIALATVSLPKAATIGGLVFQNCRSLASIYLPEVVSIGDTTFDRCISLTTVSLPKAKTMGMRVFDGCVALATVNLPEMTSFQQNAFRGCAGLATINLPKVEVIGSQAFNGCVSLATLTLGLAPPVIGTGTINGSLEIFSGAATSPRTITIKAPQLILYREISPWTDKLGANNDAGGANFFWDNNPDTRDNLTVALEAL